MKALQISPFGGLRLFPVDPGTEIEQAGRTIKVEDGNAVFRSGDIYLTHDDYSALKAKISDAAPAPSRVPYPTALGE